MDFLSFVRAHGILIDTIPPLNQWYRYPTQDHPRKKNGAVKYMGNYGLVQNHAMDTEVSIWKPDHTEGINLTQLARESKEQREKNLVLQKQAGQKAAWILNQCEVLNHPYLDSKGFKEEQGNVWQKDGKKILVIPMRLDGALVGCQMIDEAGGKKFLFGQRTSNSAFLFDNKGQNILCEGYATALSIRQTLKAFKYRYKIYVCFSANNLAKVAKDLGAGFVVADNDASGLGEKTAKETGFPYWLSPHPGLDYNDHHIKYGTIKTGSSLLQLLRS
jgi:putative DNA primase/helicase